MKQLSTIAEAQPFDFAEAVDSCVALAPKSCVAAQCQVAN
jgi:hypothetical protein